MRKVKKQIKPEFLSAAPDSPVAVVVIRHKDNCVFYERVLGEWRVPTLHPGHDLDQWTTSRGLLVPQPVGFYKVAGAAPEIFWVVLIDAVKGFNPRERQWRPYDCCKAVAPELLLAKEVRSRLSPERQAA